MTEVALIQCTDYDEGLLSRAIKDGLARIGFDLSAFKNAKVGLKPNLLTAAKPDKAVATHPLFSRQLPELSLNTVGYPF